MNMNNIAIKILNIRNRNRLTQEEFAHLLGVSRPTVSSWEAGKSVPTTEQLQKISKEFNISVDEILQTQKSVSIVIDTCVLMKRPRIIQQLLGTDRVDSIRIPETVVAELNYQKDHGKKQQAWLAMVSIERFCREYPERVSILRGNSPVGINDQKIIAAAKQLAMENRNRTVYLLTDDVYFSLTAGKTVNFQVLLLKNLEEVFPTNAGLFNRDATIRFFQAVKENHLNDVRRFFFRGVNPNYLDPETGFTPLIQAVRNRSVSMVEFLVNLPGIDCNLCDDAKYRLPAISHGVQLNEMDIVKVLVESGADVNCQSRGKNSGNTPLMISAWDGKIVFVKYFCQQGACTNQQDSNGFTALIKSCIKKHPNCVKALYGITDLKIRSLRGQTAQDYALISNNQEIINLFKQEEA